MSGCVTHFKNALTAPGTQKMDTSLCGTWGAQKENESIFIHIGKEEKSELLRIAMVEFNDKSEVEISQWSGHTTQLDNKRYLNLKWLSPKEDKQDGYLIIKYETNGDHFGFFLLEDAIVEKAVQEGRLSGKVIKEKWSSSVWVTQDQKSLQQFILKNDDLLFKDFHTFPRLKAPLAK